VTGIEHDGVLVAGTPKSSPAIAHLKRNRELARLGPEGFLIRSVKIGSRSATVIASAGEANALYGAFHFLRLLQTGRPIARLDIRQKPRLQLRLLNHWDNLDGSIERGYAGRSLWNWSALPGAVDPRLREYARANASLSTTSTPARKACPWTTCARPRLLPRLFVPLACGCISRPASRHPSSWAVSKTADPLDPAVAAWWKAKVDQIYRIIPDFGGFLVKANSEGQPGPRTYNRSHVEGANMLAAALAPHQGVLMWRAFVYDMKAGYDRFGAAYDSLQHFDGRANWVCFSLTQGAALGWSIGPFQGLSGVETRF
jgi:alpha-glucuronidase